REHRIPHDICGKLVVATREDELPRLASIHERGLANGIEDMERVDTAGIRDIEPHCTGIAGLRVGCTGIIDFPAATRKMAELAQGINPESRVALGEEFHGIVPHDGLSMVRTSKGTHRARWA